METFFKIIAIIISMIMVLITTAIPVIFIIWIVKMIWG